ncbi:MAG TPA: amidohydrolase family protein [Candidatus Marinimicrobia bacterium]|nr:amidohydrolase family protein [Candidatus Neomarinimicrobiota bacterium]
MKKVLTVLVCFLTIFSVRAANGRLAIINAELIDGKSDRVQSGVTVLISDGKIESVKRGGKVPKDYETIDIAGATLMPGFIDAHTHIRSLSSAKRALESGVTTVRSASTPNYQDVNLRELVKSGVLSGPDMVAAGVFVTPNLGETALADPRLSVLMNGVNSEEELRMLVRINADRGVDFIKTRGTERAGLPNTDPRKQTYTQEQLAVIVDEANKHNIPVMAHAHGDEGGYAAVAAGVKSIEHGTYLSEKTLKLMKQKGTYLVPTFTTVVDLTEPGGDYDNPVLFIRGQHMLSALEKTVKRAYEIGIKIVTGADTGYGPNSVTRVGMEITNFVKLGMKPMDAIRSATSVGAELLQISDRTGTVTVGKEADLVVVPDNPLEDIRSVQDVVLVISNGVIAMNRLPFSKE